MIIQSFLNRFRALKHNNNHIQYVLDIGAYKGDFTETVKAVWPTAIVYQIEADERKKQFLGNNAIIALLGNESKDDVLFYTLDDSKITTGSSIFLENTSFYNSNTTVTLKKSMTTIDILAESYKFIGDWTKHGLMKIDTQGSELLILQGATKFLQTKKPRYILTECSIIEYNLHAPRVTEVIDYMNSIGYNIVDVYDLSYDQAGSLMQMDILFERRDK